MALPIIHSPSSSSVFTRRPYHHRVLPSRGKRDGLAIAIRSQDSATDTEPANEPAPPPKKPAPAAAPGLGFGLSSATTAKASASTKSSQIRKKQKGKRERASVVRRSPVEKPSFVSSPEGEAKAKEQRKNENAFLIAWLGLGGIILVEGIVLAASGLLPEEWDKFFVKYLYPSFTPTVFLFVAGTVAYGVLKYLQNEQLKDQK